MKKSHSGSQTGGLLDLLAQNNRQTPLAESMRPASLDEVLGQENVMGKESPLRNLIENKQLTSLIFWGAPGVGKTTLARIIARNSGAHFIELSAVSSGIKELREAVAQAEENLRTSGSPTVVFIDEIHRYSKTQQDGILPYVENGTIFLMGATTENPSFQVIPALLSRVLLVRLNPLSREDMKSLIKRAVVYLGKTRQAMVISHEAIGFIVDYANGDARSALNLLEIAHKCAPVAEDKRQVEVELLEKIAQQNRLNYDRQGDEHYDHASAYQKSMRGGDADAAVYWLAKMLAGGEDPRFIARRLMITAAEDVGLADPQAFQLAVAAAEAVERLGMPEGRIPLSLATIYTAQAPKNNVPICAVDEALSDIRSRGHSYPVPSHLRDAHYSGAEDYGHGVGYVYTHDRPDAPQHFLPPELVHKRYVEDVPGKIVGKNRPSRSSEEAP